LPFYLLYVAGVRFLSAAATRPRRAAYGALFGLFCDATFDLTALALFKHWSRARGGRRRRLGGGGDGGLIDRRPAK
jgi:uncharacterized membrane protein